MLAAIDQAGRNEFIMVGGAGSKNVMDAIKADNTVLKATVTYPPSMAASAINLARLIAHGKGMSDLVEHDVPASITLASATVTKENVDQYLPARLPVLTRADRECREVTGMTEDSVPVLGVGMVGYAFMGAAHSQAWRTAGRFFDLPLGPRRWWRSAAATTPRRRPWLPGASAGGSVEIDWRALIARDDVDLVDVCTPGDTHAEIAIAALEAGKHVLCEKPLANTVEEAVAMTEVAERGRRTGRPVDGGLQLPPGPGGRARAGARRRGPARARSGTCAAQYLQDWIVDPQFPLVWRLQRDKAGSGALGGHRGAHHRPRPVRHRSAHHAGCPG